MYTSAISVFLTEKKKKSRHRHESINRFGSMASYNQAGMVERD